MNERFTWCLSSLQSPKIVDILFDTPMYAPRGSSVNFYKTKLEEQLPFLDGEVYMLDAYANVNPALTAHFISPPYFCKNSSSIIQAIRASATTAHAGTAQVSDRSK